jgi:hypothetical protein
MPPASSTPRKARERLGGPCWANASQARTRLQLTLHSAHADEPTKPGLRFTAVSWRPSDDRTSRRDGSRTSSGLSLMWRDERQTTNAWIAKKREMKKPMWVSS